MLYVPQKERARLTVGGNQFEDWTSIWVQRTWGNSYDQFKFTCAERDGATASQVNASAQFKPGDECQIELAGKLALKGIIVSRQTAYDANSRGVQLQGTNETWAYATSSVVHKTNSFDGKTYKEIVDEVLGPTGVKYDFKGEPPQDIFRYCHSEKGETNFAFLERLAKNVNVIITCTKDGEFLFVCEKVDGNQGQLIEGGNILKMQCIISMEQAYKKFIVQGQSNADDKQKYRKVSEQEETGDGNFPGKYRIKIIPMEQPDYDGSGVKKRLRSEQAWEIGAMFNATIVVYGWQPDGVGPLWEPGRYVTVKSPMAMLDDAMVIQSVTYTQDNNSGSLSTLVCVSENAFKGPKQSFIVPR